MAKRIGKVAPDNYDPDGYDVIIPDNPDYPVNPNDNINPDVIPPDKPDLPENPQVTSDEPVITRPVIIFNPEIKDYSIFIKCTWVRAFTEPKIQKNLCIISYNQDNALSAYNKLKTKTGIQPGQIGTCTGNTFTDTNKVLWIEANLFFCNRRLTGWFRYTDINVIVSKKTETKKTSWLAWLTGGITLLSLLK